MVLKSNKSMLCEWKNQKKKKTQKLVRLIFYYDFCPFAFKFDFCFICFMMVSNYIWIAQWYCWNLLILELVFCYHEISKHFNFLITIKNFKLFGFFVVCFCFFCNLTPYIHVDFAIKRFNLCVMKDFLLWKLHTLSHLFYDFR